VGPGERAHQGADAGVLVKSYPIGERVVLIRAGYGAFVKIGKVYEVESMTGDGLYKLKGTRNDGYNRSIFPHDLLSVDELLQLSESVKK